MDVKAREMIAGKISECSRADKSAQQPIEIIKRSIMIRFMEGV
jgi:hypothetical protein